MPMEIPITADIIDFELNYHLPTLSGTPRQIAWARRIRHSFLSEVLAKILDATINHPNPSEAFATLTSIRAETQAQKWIDDHRHFVSCATDYVIRFNEIREQRIAKQKLQQTKLDKAMKKLLK
jgi:hypothetical protein